MGQTMVEKIVSRQVGRTVSVGEKIERLPITKLFFNDVIGVSEEKVHLHLNIVVT